MRIENYEQVVVITSHDSKDFQNQINNTMREHSRQSPVLEMDLTSLIASVRYHETVRIPENLADEYQLNGIVITCGECPFFSLPDDKRVKYMMCDKDGSLHRCSEDRQACEWLYLEVHKGRVKL